LLGLVHVEDIGLEEHGNTSGLNGDTTFGFISTSIGVTYISSLFSGNDTGLGNQ